MDVVALPDRGFRFATGIPPYSAGVRADPERVTVRVTVADRRPAWTDGFTLIDERLASEGLPLTALCAVELRCPAPHSFGGFGSFNDDYRDALSDRGILLDDGSNPVARTNVAPTTDPGLETELHAFSYVVASTADRPGEDRTGRPSFVIAGAGDLRDQADLRPESVVGGDTPWSRSGPARAEAVLDEQERRLAALGVDWARCDEAVVYSAEDIGAVTTDVILPRIGAAGRRGVRWYHARPPIRGLLFEMDTRGGVIETAL